MSYNPKSAKHHLNLSLADNDPCKPWCILTINQSKQSKTTALLNELLNRSLLDWLYTKQRYAVSKFSEDWMVNVNEH